MIEGPVEATNEGVPLRALPVDIRANGIGQTGREVIAKIVKGTVKEGPVAAVCFVSINTDSQAPKN